MSTGISEIFSSIQGEGRYVGCRQLFIRLIGCNMDCPYCDTNEMAHKNVPCVLEPAAGYRGSLELPNPVSWDELMPYIAFRLQQPHHSISITGGEPLLHTAAIKELSRLIMPYKLPLFLETNGTLPEALAQVIDAVQMISMDMKLPSDTGEDHWEAHRRFLQIAVQAQKDIYVKIVISAESTPADFDKALSIIEAVDPATLLVLQPITPMGGLHPAAPQKLLDWQSRAMQRLRDVRVIPQTHRMMNVL